MVEHDVSSIPSSGSDNLWKGTRLRPKRGEFDRPRRFYASASVSPTPVGFAVSLDGRVARTPGGNPLQAPVLGLAELVASEWSAQNEFIDYYDMPATRLLQTTIDAIPDARDETAKSVARYAESDLICYPAEGTRGLVERQRLAWTPLLGWARDALGLEFQQTHGLIHQSQPAATIDRVRAIAGEADDYSLAGLAFGASLFGSAVLVLALRAGFIDGPSAHAAATIEETFQEERWGVDEEAAARSAVLLRDAIMLERWLVALQSD